jgi:hypothetical protein
MPLHNLLSKICDKTRAGAPELDHENAQFIVYADSNHGAQYQHTKIFLEHVKLFLRECD